MTGCGCLSFQLLEGRWRIWRILNWFQFSWKWWIFCCFWVRLFLRCSPFFKVRKTEQIKMPTLSANRVGDVLRDIWTSLKASTFWSGCFLYIYYMLLRWFWQVKALNQYDLGLFAFLDCNCFGTPILVPHDTLIGVCFVSFLKIKGFESTDISSSAKYNERFF